MGNVQEPASLSQRVAAALNGQPAKQKLSTYASTATNNLQGQGGVGVTAGGVKAKSVTYKGAGNPNRSYSVEIINKARAKIGGNK